MTFDDVKKGYSKEQVDDYMAVLKAEYSSLLKELEGSEKELKDFHAGKKQMMDRLEKLQLEKRELLERIETLEMSDKPAFADAIAATLINAKVSSKEMLDKAEVEARQILERARKEASELISKAENEATLIREGAADDLSEVIEIKKSIIEQIKIMTSWMNEFLLNEEKMKKIAKTEDLMRVTNIKEV